VNSEETMGELNARIRLGSPGADETDAGAVLAKNTTVWRPLLTSLRPYQWVKNSLLFGGLIFSRSLADTSAVWLTVGAFFSFCMASSGIYLLNDLRDLVEDRAHPLKRLRPLASGALNPTVAKATMAVLMVAALICGFRLRTNFGWTLLAYVLINLAYSIRLKRVVILEVMIVAVCFVVRAVAGAVVIGVSPSSWLVLCTLMLALLVGFGKRRHEKTLMNTSARNHRASLEQYTLQFLDLMMAISAGAAVVTYALYTMAEETVRRFGSGHLVLTVPFVVYGIFRYLFLIHQSSAGGDPSRLFVTDRPTIINCVLWISVVCVIVYGSNQWLPW